MMMNDDDDGDGGGGGDDWWLVIHSLNSQNIWIWNFPQEEKLGSSKNAMAPAWNMAFRMCQSASFLYTDTANNLLYDTDTAVIEKD